MLRHRLRRILERLAQVALQFRRRLHERLLRRRVLLARLPLERRRFLDRLFRRLADRRQLGHRWLHHFFHRLRGLIGRGPDRFAQELRGILLHAGDRLLQRLLHHGLMFARVLLERRHMLRGRLHGLAQNRDLLHRGLERPLDGPRRFGNRPLHRLGNHLARILLQLAQCLFHRRLDLRLLRRRHFLQRRHVIGRLLQRAAQTLHALPRRLAQIAQRLRRVFLEGRHRLGERLLHHLLVLRRAPLHPVTLLANQLRRPIQPREKLRVRPRQRTRQHIRQRPHVAARRVRAVVQPRQQNLVAIRIDVIEQILLDLLQRRHREAQQDRVNQRQQRRVERRRETPGDIAERRHQSGHVLGSRHDRLEITDGHRQPEHCADEPENRNHPHEHPQHREAPADPRPVDVRLIGHHRRHIPVHLPRLEQLERLANAVDHHAVPQLHRERIHMGNEDMNVALVNLPSQILGHHIQQHRVALMLELEEFQNQKTHAPAEANRLHEVHPTPLIQDQVVERFLERQRGQIQRGKHPHADDQRQPRIGIRRVAFLPSRAPRRRRGRPLAVILRCRGHGELRAATRTVDGVAGVLRLDHQLHRANRTMESNHGSIFLRGAEVLPCPHGLRQIPTA